MNEHQDIPPTKLSEPPGLHGVDVPATRRVAQLAIEIDVLPPALHPASVFDYSGQMISSLIHDPLFSDGEEPWTASAGAAEEATTTDGGRTWRVRLSPSGRWSDGHSLTAADLVRSVESLADPAIASPLGWLAENIEGMVESRMGRTAPRALPGCYADGEDIVVFRMRRPIAYADRLLAASCFAPVSSYSGVDNESLASGPFRLTGEFPGGRGLILEQNSFARRHRSSSYQRLAFLRTNGPEQGLRLYEAGVLDITCNTTFPPAAVRRYHGTVDYLQQGFTMSVQLQIMSGRFNLDRRRAITLAIDRDEISAELETVVRPLWRHTDLWFPVDEAVPRRRPDIARRLWRSAMGTSPERITLAYTDFSPNGDAVRLIAAHIEDALGIVVSLRPICYEEYIASLTQDRFDLLYTLTPAAYDEPSCMLAPYRRGGFGARHAGFDDADFTHQLDAAEAEPDLALRLELYRRANDRLLDQLPFIPLFRSESIVLRRACFQGFSMTRGGLVPFERIVAPSSEPDVYFNEQ